MRTVGSSRGATWPMIRRAGIDLLSKHGFEGMNLRDLARAAGLQGGGSLYNYFSSKEGFLFRLMCEVMEEILSDLEASVGPMEDPIQRMRAFVEFHIKWHTERRKETFIGNMEIRSLSEERRAVYVGLRKRYEDFVANIISTGCERGVFSVPDVKVATFGLLSMLTGVCYWFRPTGRLSQRRLIDIHTVMVLSLLNAGPMPSRHLSSRSAKRAARTQVRSRNNVTSRI